MWRRGYGAGRGRGQGLLLNVLGLGCPLGKWKCQGGNWKCESGVHCVNL